MGRHISANTMQERIEQNLLRHYGMELEFARPEEIYKSVCMVVREIASELRQKNSQEVLEKELKEVYYLSMEFLPGPSLRNNLFNLGLEDNMREALNNIGRTLEELYAIEPDAGLGNGGLGRLASCYLDALSTNGMVGHGMSICYEYGIFKQKISNEGKQIEIADDWMNLGESWLLGKEDEIQEVHLGGKLTEVWNDKGEMKLIHSEYTKVLALPRDMLITGYESTTVNKLRLWQSKSPFPIDMELFAQGKYLQAMEQEHMADVISKILYPEDAHTEGKSLRITQQYFFICASMQNITDRHLASYGTLDNLSDKIAIHINDTHPAMAIPELMRILMDVYQFPWEKAWAMVSSCVSYTNHTVMPEALEQWPEDLFAKLLPRIHSIIKEINRRQSIRLAEFLPKEEDTRKATAIISDGKIRMANLCVEASHSVNGVSALHSEIIKTELFNGFYRQIPEKFTNVTNGIAYRRWLCQANPRLANLIEETCGPGFRNDASQLEKLLNFKNDKGVLDELEKIKTKNKLRMAAYIRNYNGISVNPDSLFDVQVKRIHEYKRQLLNLMHIMDLYTMIKEDPYADIQPRTFIFSGKASAGYFLAKQIIKLAYNLSVMINSDPAVNERIRIVFLENYSVSLSEIIMPAAEISEQISLAGKEASGTGNMKLMINGAITLGTLDGANVEIREAVGDDNIFLFGMKVDEVEDLRKSGTYNPWSYCRDHQDIGRVIALISEKINGQSFMEIMNYLTTGGFNSPGDPYFILADYQSYKTAQTEVAAAYRDRNRWNAMSLTNIAKAGVFSADRSVKEYASKIWNIKPL